MIAVNEVIELEIETVILGGEGLGFFENYAIFVPQALPGERVEVTLISVKKKYARGVLNRIITRSPHRIDTKLCPHAYECGGCDLIFCDYAYQLTLKDAMIQSEIQKHKIDTEYKAIIASPEISGYRNKVIQPFAIAEGGIVSGFYQAKTHTVLDIESCFVQKPVFNAIMGFIKKALKQHGISVYSEERKSGVLRNVMIRSNKKGQLLVAFIVTGKHAKLSKLVTALAEKFPEVESVYYIINTREDNVLLTEEVEHIYGKKVLYEQLFECYFQMSPLSFFQINMYQTERLYDIAINLMANQADATVLDAYSGTGTLGMLVSKHVKKVIGIESVKSAVNDAEKMMKRNRIDNCEFFHGKVETVLPKLIHNGVKIHSAIIDPPRKGIEESVIRDFNDHKICEVVYISCNPATFFRDAVRFIALGYHLDVIQSVDMFPHTSHIELVGKFKKEEQL